MIVLSTLTDQTIEPGQSITFDQTILKCGNNEGHRGGSASVKLRMHGIYDVRFSGVISAPATGDAVLILEIGGERLTETRMAETISLATTQFKDISTSTYVKNQCGDYDRVTVTNIGAAAVTVAAGANLNIRRVCG